MATNPKINHSGTVLHYLHSFCREEEGRRTHHPGQVGRGAIGNIEKRWAGKPGGHWEDCLALAAGVDAKLRSFSVQVFLF